MSNFKRNIFLLLMIMAIGTLLTGCGVFKKGCDCPKFGKANTISTIRGVA